MAFAIVSMSAVNLGVVMRREREAPWSTPIFPWFGWIILGFMALAVGATLLLLGDDPTRYDLASAPESGRRGGLAFTLGRSRTLPTVLVVGRF